FMDSVDFADGFFSWVWLDVLIKMMANNAMMPYLFLGFVGVMYLKMDVVGVAVVGLCLALLAVQKLTFEEEEDL
uniref:PTS sugar transporter subunit IIC n=1 Tax=Enterococcus faecium TaxID=1352 RepID=UPI0030C7B3DB